MEQATNLFNKGLQMDTHPMVLGNDTLTDALNATLITMNGNEVILLNDMGNRRVDSAFLPSGYLPVGMKEYGGVIYVAAYNPITNKSLIGSFPSPEKKMDSKESPELLNSFDFDSILNSTNVEEDSNLEIQVLKSDSFMIPLTGDINLRAGDKFAIYSPGLSYLSGSLTNYNNILENKAYSPKNRKYTLLVGILNSLNEFVDITKTLCRWKKTNENWNPKVYDSEISETFKFNDEYFIADDFSGTDFFETIDDSKLIKYRQTLEANTYSYKLVGPMYLKVNFNHIENFNYNIYGLKNDVEQGHQLTYTLWIEGYLTYNCPDGASEPFDSNSNENYVTFEEGTPMFSGFNLINETVAEVTRSTSVYDPKTNLYTTKIIKKYSNITPTLSNIYEYVIGVLADEDVNNPNNNVYLRGLSMKGQIDLSLLGSGKVSVEGWKFYNNLELQLTTLTFSFNAYPEYGKSFDNLRFIFHNVEDNDNSNDVTYPEDGGLPLYNGRQTYTFGWENLLLPRKVYKVTIKYDILPEDLSNPQTLVESLERWFITTELFNEFYSSTSGVNDFCTEPTEDNGVITSFGEKMLINLTSNENIENNSRFSEAISGGLTSITNNLSYICNHNIELNLVDNSKLSIKDEESYPDFITVNSNKENSLVINNVNVILIGENDNITNYSSDFLNEITTFLGVNMTTNSKTPFDNETFLDVTTNVNEKVVSGNISYKDVYKGYSTSLVSNITNGFDALSNILDEAIPVLSNLSISCGGVIINYDRTYPAGHFVEVARKLLTFAIENLPPDDYLSENYERIYDVKKNGLESVNFTYLLDSIYTGLNGSLFTPGQMFLFIFLGGLDEGLQDPKKLFFSSRYHSGMSTVTYEPSKGDLYARWNTRLWWRAVNGEWAVFNKLFSIDSGDTSASSVIYKLKKFIKDELHLDYIYCMYNDYTGNITLYTTSDDYIHTNEYKIPIILNISYNLASGESVETIVNNITTSNNKDVGTLKFRGGELLNISGSNVKFNLTSSMNFHNYLAQFDPSNISNVEISTGLAVDSLGRTLDPQYLYYKSNTVPVQLIRVNNHYFKADLENSLNGKNPLIYNRLNFSRPLLSLQISSKDEDSTTVLIYNTINVISDE